MSDSPIPDDPFANARRTDGVLKCPFQGESIPMILRHADVRKAAKDWKTYSSDAAFRVPIPSEEDVRTMRQLPIETNPPEHTEYRAIVEPFFQRSKTPEVTAKVETLIKEKLTEAIRNESTEIVNEFALPIQSRALTYLLNVPNRKQTSGSIGASMFSKWTALWRKKERLWRPICTNNWTVPHPILAKIFSVL